MFFVWKLQANATCVRRRSWATCPDASAGTATTATMRAIVASPSFAESKTASMTMSRQRQWRKAGRPKALTKTTESRSTETTAEMVAKEQIF